MLIIFDLLIFPSVNFNKIGNSRVEVAAWVIKLVDGVI